MKTLIRASACPACGGVHGDAPAWWPTCPQHGHWLKERRTTGDGIVYGCAAPKCTHTQTLTGRITMTTEQAATAALAIRDGQEAWTPTQLAAFRQLGMDGAPDEDLAVFLYRCQVTRLDPFAKQIRLRKDRQSVQGPDGKWRYEDRWSIETEIEGYRVIAQRAARDNGVTLHYGDPVWYDAAEGEHKIWLSADPPAGASFTVYKDGHPFKGTVAFTEFALMKDGKLLANWRTMPAHMIAKCAEALALRMAFPHDLEGIDVADGAAPAEPQITVTQVTPPAPRQQVPRDGVVLKALAAAIDKQFDRIEVPDDPDERENWVRRLNQDAEGELTADQLRVALGILGEHDRDGYAIPDLAALIDLCAVEAS